MCSVAPPTPRIVRDPDRGRNAPSSHVCGPGGRSLDDVTVGCPRATARAGPVPVTPPRIRGRSPCLFRAPRRRRPAARIPRFARRPGSLRKKGFRAIRPVLPPSIWACPPPTLTAASTSGNARVLALKGDRRLRRTSSPQRAKKSSREGGEQMSLEIFKRPEQVEPVEAPGTERSGLSRRMFLRAGALGAGAVGLSAATSLLAPNLAGRGLWTPDGVFGAASIAWADNIYTEVFPTSPLILNPFSDELNVPKTQRPASGLIKPSEDQQNSYGSATNNAQKHQIWCDDTTKLGTYATTADPVFINLDVNIDEHSFTTSQVLPINSSGQPTGAFDAAGKPLPAGPRKMPSSTQFRFAGGLPRINAMYGKPVVVRFNNTLDKNPKNLDVQDFGAPDRSFLTHLHNGHTAPESDGNPHYSMRFGPKHQGYPPGTYVDNLYLNWPAGGQESEKQSFFWFHDHRMDHTGSNVYKGCVGMYPIYDPVL